MTLVMTSLLLECVFQSLFTFTLILIGGNLTAQSTESHRGIGDVAASSPPFPTLLPERPGELAHRLTQVK